MVFRGDRPTLAATAQQKEISVVRNNIFTKRTGAIYFSRQSRCTAVNSWTNPCHGMHHVVPPSWNTRVVSLLTTPKHSYSHVVGCCWSPQLRRTPEDTIIIIAHSTTASLTCTRFFPLLSATEPSTTLRPDLCEHPHGYRHNLRARHLTDNSSGSFDCSERALAQHATPPKCLRLSKFGAQP